MDRLLKHFGLGGKRSPAHQPYKSDYASQNTDSSQDLDTKGIRSSDYYGTERMVAYGRDHDIRRSNSEYSRTLPTSGEFRGSNLNREHNWSLHRGKNARLPVHSTSLKENESSVQNFHETDEEGTGLSVSREEACEAVSSKKRSANAIPLSDDYSDPYDLRSQAMSVTTPAEEAEVVVPTDVHENDYSVPYDLRSRPKGIEMRESEKRFVSEKVPVAEKIPEKVPEKVPEKIPEKVPVMYDDPYEESPLIPIALSARCQRQEQEQRWPAPPPQQHWLFSSDAEESFPKKSLFTQTGTLVEDLSQKSVEECTKRMAQLSASDSLPKVQSNASVGSGKLYQLSAEYGGLDDEDESNDVGNYTDLQEECCLKEPLAKPVEESGGGGMNPPVARHARMMQPPGMYDEPWDLSVAQRGLEDRLFSTQSVDSVSSKRLPVDVMSASSITIGSSRLCDGLMSRSCYAEALRQNNSCGATSDKAQELRQQKNSTSSFPVYGVPWSMKSKDGKRDMNASRTQIVMGNCSSSSHGPGVNKVKVPVRSSSLKPVDSRPMEDYDEPWDQKTKITNKTASETNGQSVSLTSPLSSQHITNTVSSSWSSTLAEQIDTKLPLEKQLWYHGNISRVEAENLLRVHREGSYLIRNSESNRKDYSLSVKSALGFMHMKIVANTDGCFILGQFSQPFHNIAQMILHYTIHKLPIKGAEHMSLMFPVRTKLL